MSYFKGLYGFIKAGDYTRRFTLTYPSVTTFHWNTMNTLKARGFIEETYTFVEFSAAIIRENRAIPANMLQR